MKRGDTHCDNGHEMTPENTRLNTENVRICRQCQRLYQKNYILKKVEKIVQMGLRPYVKRFCRRDHEFTPENTLLIARKNKGGSFKRCLTCIAEDKALRARLNTTGRKRGGSRVSDTCRLGHYKTGDNLIEWTHPKTGKVTRTCRECRNAYAAKRERLIRRGIKPPLKNRQYKSVREAMEAHMEPVGDCVHWLGPMSAGTCPSLRLWGDTYSVRRWVCEQNGREIGSNQLPAVPRTCDLRCVRNEHILVATRKELYWVFQTQESRQRAGRGTSKRANVLRLLRDACA